MLSLGLSDLGQQLNNTWAGARCALNLESGSAALLVYSMLQNGLWNVSLLNHVMLVLDRLWLVMQSKRLQQEGSCNGYIDVSLCEKEPNEIFQSIIDQCFRCRTRK